MSNEPHDKATRSCCASNANTTPAVQIRVDDLSLTLFACRTCLPQALQDIGVELQSRIVDDIQLSMWVNLWEWRPRYD